MRSSSRVSHDIRHSSLPFLSECNKPELRYHRGVACSCRHVCFLVSAFSFEARSDARFACTWIVAKFVEGQLCESQTCCACVCVCMCVLAVLLHRIRKALLSYVLAGYQASGPSPSLQGVLGQLAVAKQSADGLRDSTIQIIKEFCTAGLSLPPLNHPMLQACLIDTFATSVQATCETRAMIDRSWHRDQIGKIWSQIAAARPSSRRLPRVAQWICKLLPASF